MTFDPFALAGRLLPEATLHRLIRIFMVLLLGAFLAATAVAAIRFSAVNVVLLLLFSGLQLWRTHMEEAKLAAVFPEYREFAGRSWWFWG